MAGSLSDFKYFDDNGKAWLIRIDKSNALVSGTGFTVLSKEDLSLDYLPRNIEVRYVRVVHPTRPITRKLYCQSTTADLWIGKVNEVSLTDYQDRSLQKFKVRDRIRERTLYSAKLIDTYQNDSP